MPRVEMDLATTAPVERVRAALLDFTENRPNVWPGLDPQAYEVYEIGETSAEIREGSKMPLGRVWARERYDWSDPDKIRWTVVESNFSAPGSFVEAQLAPAPEGGTRLHLIWNREGTNWAGMLVVRLIAATKGRPVAASVEAGLSRLEAPG